MSKQASKRKRVTKAAVPALGAAGLTFSLAGGASASALPNADTPQKLNVTPSQSVLLGEEEIADRMRRLHRRNDSELRKTRDVGRIHNLRMLDAPAWEQCQCIDRTVGRRGAQQAHGVLAREPTITNDRREARRDPDRHRVRAGRGTTGRSPS